MENNQIKKGKVMRNTLKHTGSYLEDVNFHITNCDESCEDLARCMKALNWSWVNSKFETPSSIEIKNTLLNLFELGEKYLMRAVREDLEKVDGAYSIASGGFILTFLFNHRTMELYGLKVVFDIWQHKIEQRNVNFS